MVDDGKGESKIPLRFSETGEAVEAETEFTLY